MKRLVLSALLLSTCQAQPSYAQGRLCAERDKLIGQLESQHGETRQSVGLQRDRGVIETFANTDTGSWTIIVSLPTGISCLVAAGDAFSIEYVKPKGDPA